MMRAQPVARSWTWRSLCIACAVITSAALLSACASSADTKADSAALKAAKSIERRAAQSFAANDYVSAAAGYESAALVYESLALPEPLARARLSQARALADAGQAAKAQSVVSSVLQTPDGLSPDVLVTAHGRAAALVLGAGTDSASLARAQAHVQSAAQLCANSCAQLSAITVLRARAELLANQAAASAASASAALAAAQNDNDRANALRARAQANAALAQYAQVLADARQALQIDQDLGAASRVVTDLQLMQSASAGVGDAPAAARYGALAQRAQAAAVQLAGSGAPAAAPMPSASSPSAAQQLNKAP
jgi:hypothetical protein